MSGEPTKTIHRIWLSDPMPPAFAGFGAMWQAMNPGWTVRDWTDPADLSFLQNRDLFNRAREVFPDDWKRFQADLVRLEILYVFGGLYVDTDSEPRAPIPDMRWGCVVPRSPGTRMRGGKPFRPLTNAVMYATPGHPFMRDCIARLPKRVARYEGTGRDLALVAGPWLCQEVFEEGTYPDMHTPGPEEFFVDGFVKHHWNNRLRKRGEGLG